MIKLVVKHVNDHLNEKYTWPEKIILIILFGYLLFPVNSTHITQSQLFAINHIVKVMVSMVFMRTLFDQIGYALDELEIKQPKHWVLNKSLFKPKTTNPAVVNLCTIAIILIFIIIITSAVTGMESPLLMGFAAEVVSKMILYKIYQKLTGD